MTRIALALLASVAAAPLAISAELPLASRIDAVTVFPDAAAVTRIGEVRVPAGQHVVVLRGLPATIDPASIRIEGASDGQLVIGSADVRRAPAQIEAQEDSQKRLRELQAELAAVRGRIDALEAQKRAVAEFARLAAEAAVKDGKGFDLAQARAAWTAVGEGTAAANEALQVQTARAAEVEARIRAIETAAGRPRPGAAPVVDLAVSVEAASALSAALTVTYRVGSARWTAVYDAALDTAANGPARINLVRRASVSQRTGEDWEDVALTLSTARVAGGASAPMVMTQTLSLREPYVVLDAQRQRARQTAETMERAQTMAPPAPQGPPELARASEQEAQSMSSTFSASFVAPGRVTVARDGAARVLRLSSHGLEAPLLAKVAPALEPRAYLSASLTWTGEAPLLPGEVSLMRDGVFVGKASISAVAAGDGFELGFGADDRIKVERVPVRRRDNDPSGWSASRNQLSDHRTTITNLHRRPMRISVVDRIPVSENSAVTVEALPTNTPATDKTVQDPRGGIDQRGVMAWTHDYAPGEKRDIRLGWRLRWPADRELTIQ
jgi:uncharacterized protein (TIGR02231 family)